MLVAAMTRLLWWRGKPDRFWSPWRRDIFVARDHLVRHRFHDDLAHPVRKAHPNRSNRHRFDPGANAKVRNGPGTGETSTVAAWAISASARACTRSATRACSGAAASARAEPGAEEVVTLGLVIQKIWRSAPEFGRLRSLKKSSKSAFQCGAVVAELADAPA